MKLKKEEPSAEIPASSMADIAFLLIVYFMVTTTFAATRGLDFALPEDDDTPPLIEPEDAVLVAIQGDGTLLVDQRPMLPGEILAYLEPKLSVNAKKPVIIQPAPESHYGKMVEVFDELRHGKIIDGKLVWLAKDPTLTKEQLDEGKDINISIPTRREIEAFWF